MWLCINFISSISCGFICVEIKMPFMWPNCAVLMRHACKCWRRSAESDDSSPITQQSPTGTTTTTTARRKDKNRGGKWASQSLTKIYDQSSRASRVSWGCKFAWPRGIVRRLLHRSTLSTQILGLASMPLFCCLRILDSETEKYTAGLALPSWQSVCVEGCTGGFRKMLSKHC